MHFWPFEQVRFLFPGWRLIFFDGGANRFEHWKRKKMINPTGQGENCDSIFFIVFPAQGKIISAQRLCFSYTGLRTV